MELETLHAKINSLFSAYNAAVLPKVAEANNLRAGIAQAIYVLDPTDTARSESREARSSADEAEKDRQGQAEAAKDGQPQYRTSAGDSGVDGESEAVLYAGERSHQRGHIRAHRLGLFTFEQHTP